MFLVLNSFSAGWAGTPADSAIKETTTAQGLTAATAMGWAPDGSNRLFVTRKGGEVRIIKNGSLLSTPFATLSPVYTNSECGLLGICFDPGFVSNRYVYLFVTISASEQQIIRYTASGDVGGNKTVLIRNLPTRGANHNGGHISIGPDNKLYWAIGDLGNGTGVDSDLSSLASKVGRANLDGSAPNDNPYFNSSDGIGPTDFIWARGFRNPFAHAWHKATGKMWVNVAGEKYEQVFAVAKGAHGGWNDYEGGSQPAGYVKPAIQYVTNGGVGGCVTGGAFYNGIAYPSQYRGNYFYCDYSSQRILRAVVDSTGSVTSSNTTFVSSTGSLIDLCEGPDGALYYVNYGGDVRRLAYASTTQELIVSTTSLAMVEGTSSAFSVRLALPPSSTMTVNAARTSGDGDVTLASGSTLSFTSGNYSVPQSVTIAAAHDTDISNDSASISASSSGLATKTIAVSVSDDDTQSFILSSSALSVTEGKSVTFTVRLANAPASTVTATVMRTSGDSDISITSGSSLVFTSSNYAIPQTVSILAGGDSDSMNDTAIVSVSASGIPSRTVSVSVVDDDAAPPVFTSTPLTKAISGLPYSYDANATGLPAPTYSLALAPSGMSIHSGSGLISWSPSSSGNFNVTLGAANGISPNASQSFTITVSTDQAPTARITRPIEGETVSGSAAEWYGDGLDDGGTLKAEFYVDGVLKFTEASTSGHYHYGGAHNAWDTRILSNGPHVLKMIVYDAKGQSGSQSVTVTVSNPASSGLSSPQNLKATPADTKITLNWTSVSGATAYRVKRNKILSDPFTTIATVTSPAYTDTGLSNGRQYNYVVSAINSTSESPNSAVVTATPGSSTTSVSGSAPTGLAGTAGNESATLTWNSFTGATSYNVKRSKIDGGPYSAIANVFTPKYQDTGLVNGRAYFYVVSAATSSGETPNSNQAKVVPGLSLTTSSTVLGRDMNAVDQSSLPRIAIDLSKDGFLRISVSGTSPGDYAIERSSNLVDWHRLKTLTLGAGRSDFSETLPVASAEQFYRVQRLQPATAVSNESF